MCGSATVPSFSAHISQYVCTLKGCSDNKLQHLPLCYVMENHLNQISRTKRNNTLHKYEGIIIFIVYFCSLFCRNENALTDFKNKNQIWNFIQTVLRGAAMFIEDRWNRKGYCWLFAFALRTGL